MATKQSYKEADLLKDLIDWLKIPSISALPEHKPDIDRAVSFIEAKLKSLGFKTQVWETPGKPSLFAQRIEDSKLPTLLIYGHLDVQPVDPLEQWKNPPFEPWREDGKLYGRGAADDKGQVMIHVKACESLIREAGCLPVNIKFIIEGEEEIGSPNFEFLVKEHKESLKSDATIVSDTATVAEGFPSISYATRGLVYFEIYVEGPRVDLHSGSFGGAVKNPLLVLSQILTALIDKKGKVTIPGFYKDVVSLSKQEGRWFKRVKFLEGEIKKVAGAELAGGEKNTSLLERVWARPTFEVHGLSGGFEGKGSKTIIPQKAMAKVSCRLVPKQNPDRIAKAFVAYIHRLVSLLCPSPPSRGRGQGEGVRVTVRQIPGGGPAFLEDVNQPVFKVAAQALKNAFGRDPVFIRCGGSIFAPEIFKRHFPKTPILLMGFGLPGENAHAPNEWLSLKNYELGIAACQSFYQLL